MPITPDYLALQIDLLQTHKKLQESILRDIVRRLVKTDFSLTDTAAWQIEKLNQSGMLYSEIISEVAALADKSKKEIKEIFSNASLEVFNYAEDDIKSAGYEPKTFRSLSEPMKKLINASLRKTCTNAANLTKTTAVTSQTAYIKSADLAHMQIVSGAFSYTDAIKNAIKYAADESISVIYPSGHVSSLDIAMRRAVLTGVNQTYGEVSLMRAEDLDTDIMEITAHMGARPEHSSWQGKLVSRSGKAGYLSLSDIGYGEVAGFMGANCRHNWFPFFEGISKRSYSDRELEKMASQKVEYNGKQLTLYEAAQRQRKLERSIRKTKASLVASEELIKNADDKELEMSAQLDFNVNSVLLKGQEAKLSDFCSKTGLSRDRYREQVFAAKTEKGIGSFGKSTAQKAVSSAKKRYSEFVSVVGKDLAPATLDKYYELKYNNCKSLRYIKVAYKRKKKLLDNPNLKLNNSESVYIDDRKFTEYLFDGNNKDGLAKGKAITSRLGYDISNWQELQKILSDNADGFPVTFKSTIEQGDKYEQLIIIKGLKGKFANIKIGWLVNDAHTHLTTVFLEEL